MDLKKEPIFFQDGPKRPIKDPRGSTKEPRWFQDGSQVDPSLIPLDPVVNQLTQVGPKKAHQDPIGIP